MSTNREKAMKWWSELPGEVRQQACDKHHSSRQWTSLTGREIEVIFENEKSILTINGKDHRVPTDAKGFLLIEAEQANALRENKECFTLLVGGFSFLGEGSGPFEQGDDRDPERRAVIVGDVILAGRFTTLEQAERAGEEAISYKGYYGAFGDNYVVPEAAGMRFFEE